MTPSDFRGPARRALADLHRTLLEVERIDYERLHGRLSDGAFLDVVIKDPDFAWLGALTTLIVCLDELHAGAQGEVLGTDCFAQIRKLLTPAAGGGEFNRKYEVILQRSPEVVVAHGAVMRALQDAQPRGAYG